MNNTRLIYYTVAILPLLFVCQVLAIASPQTTTKRAHTMQRHIREFSAVEVRPLCKLPALEEAAATPNRVYVSSLQMGVVCRTSQYNNSWDLLGFKMQLVEFTGKKKTNVYHCTLNVDEATGLSRALGHMLDDASRWRNHDMGYRGVAFSTHSGFELHFTQNENQMQTAFAFCNPGGGNKFNFGDVRQLAQLKQSIDGRMMAWHAAQMAHQTLEDWQSSSDREASR